MKSQIKKISFAVVLLLFCACSNSNSSQAGNNQEATLFSQRESFSNTIAAKLFRKYYHYDISSKEEILKDEYETIEDLIKNLYPNRWKTVIANSKKDVEEAEKIAKTKFYRSKDRMGFSKYIFFGTVENTGNDIAIMYIGDNFISFLKKYSTKEMIEEGFLYFLRCNLRDSLDIPSFGLDKVITEKLIEAQNY